MTRPETEKKLISAREIAYVLGVSPTCAGKMMRAGAFGQPIKLTYAGARTHFRVTRDDFNAYIKTHINEKCEELFPV